ncbi:MAG: type II toxin-antitoxin system RatA family toxin [bacterium]|nr:type II toxin-antitoxin system RatA family toxin [bacterium]
MTTVARSALLAYSAQEIFALVNDVASYREFLPFCIASEVLEAGSGEMQARIAFSRMGLSQSLITRNRLTPHSEISIEFVSGPFEFLRGRWEFLELHASACKVNFSMDFQLQAKFLQFAAVSAINQGVGQTVDAFQRRAVQVYGQR